MECSKCGEKIEYGELFCPFCGAEIQIVSDKTTLEEDLLLNLMHEEQIEAEQEEAWEDEEEEPKKNRILPLVICNAIIVCIISVIVLLVFNM